MARCGCASTTCSCFISNGSGTNVAGTGSSGSPYVISLADSATTTQTTTASSATPTPTGQTKWNELFITAQAAAAAFAAPTGTPVNGNYLTIRIKDNGTARALTWNAIYRGVSGVLPTTTTLGKVSYYGFRYNADETKWDLVSSITQP